MPKITIKTEAEGLEIWEPKIKEAMNNIIKFEKAKAKAEAGINAAKQDLMVIFPMLNMEEPKLQTTTQGTFSYVGPGISKSFNKDVAKTFLAQKGVDIDLITSAWDEATTESERVAYVKWDKPKAKKK